MNDNVQMLGQWTRAVEKAGPDGPCIVIQERQHEHDEWDESVVLYTEEAVRLLEFMLSDIDGIGSTEQ